VRYHHIPAPRPTVPLRGACLRGESSALALVLSAALALVLLPALALSVLAALLLLRPAAAYCWCL